MNIQQLVTACDPDNQFKVLSESYKQIEFAWNNKIDLSKIKKGKIDKIILAGLGGSAISGDLLQNFLKDELNFPFIVIRNYDLPKYADKKSLVIVSSYSGNTEEAISVLKNAIKNNCQIVAVTSGGKIEIIAKKNNIPVVKILPGFQPRYALGLSFFSLLKIFQTLKLIKDQNSVVKRIINNWKTKARTYSEQNNPALLYARSLLGFIPVIYSVDGFNSAAGYRLKSQFNENSKLHSFHNVLPEFNHNEIIGWETFSEYKFNAKVIFLSDKNYHKQIKKRIEVCSSLLSGKKVEIITLSSNEKTFKERLLDLIFLGDWISYYLAVLRNHNPSEIDFIHYLKKNLE